MYIEKLLSIASPATLALAPTNEFQVIEGGCSATLGELMRMLSTKNGFYAFESALHVLPSTLSTLEMGGFGFQAWNDVSLWRGWYQSLTDGLLFFAEDVFGGQFAIRGNEVVTFDPESGDIEVLALSLEGWAEKLLADYPLLTGYPLAHEWQVTNGPIPIGKRLLPKTPFVLGGPFQESNLYAIDAVQGMRYRGELWEQFRVLPDGAQVQLKVLPLQ